MGVKKLNRGLCCVAGRYRRTIGKFINAEHKVAPKKFLLGTDRKHAELANLRLEQLWDEVVQATKRENEERLHQWQAWQAAGIDNSVRLNAAPTGMSETWREQMFELNNDQPPAAKEPLWTQQTLEIAEVIRRGQNTVIVPVKQPHSYAEDVVRLRDNFSGVQFVPQDLDLFRTVQAGHAAIADVYARNAREAARTASLPMPSGTGQTLYDGLDAYRQWARENKIRGGKLTAWGKVLGEQVERIKDATKDMPLEAFDYNAIERVRDYWARRPISKYGRPIALDTVRTQMNAFKLFCKWLHRNPAWKWRKPEDFDDVVKIALAGLMSQEEVAGLKNGVQVYTVLELETIWRYATDKEKVLVGLALNCGFARTECVTLRLDEIELGESPGYIKRIRGKSRVYGEWMLWDVTAKALEWVSAERSKVDPMGSKPWAILSERGQQMAEHRVANVWNFLLDRIQKDEPGFRRLPFKHLRKTGAQLVRNLSDGETASVYLAHGNPVKADDLAGVYSNPVFGRVHEALRRVRQLLAPVFDGTPEAFARPRAKGSPNITRKTLDSIVDLHRAGLHPLEIARKAGVSRATAYRRIAELKLIEDGPGVHSDATVAAAT